MEILCIIDSVDNIDKKLSILETLGAEIKFFVDAKHVPSLVKNKSIVSKITAIYNNNVNKTIDKYLRESTYKPTETILYYTSAELNVKTLDNIREELKLKPDTVYVKKKFSWWTKFKLWFYDKLINLIFGTKDAYASVKLQYFSADLMDIFRKTTFRNHIFEIDNSATVELEKEEEKTYYSKPKFDKNYLYAIIMLCVILIFYVVLERFFDLKFGIYFLIIALLLLPIITLIVMIIKNNFDMRFKK